MPLGALVVLIVFSALHDGSRLIDMHRSCTSNRWTEGGQRAERAGAPQGGVGAEPRVHAPPPLDHCFMRAADKVFGLKMGRHRHQRKDFEGNGLPTTSK